MLDYRIVVDNSIVPFEIHGTIGWINLHEWLIFMRSMKEGIYTSPMDPMRRKNHLKFNKEDAKKIAMCLKKKLFLQQHCRYIYQSHGFLMGFWVLNSKSSLVVLLCFLATLNNEEEQTKVTQFSYFSFQFLQVFSDIIL